MLQIPYLTNHRVLVKWLTSFEYLTKSLNHTECYKNHT